MDHWIMEPLDWKRDPQDNRTLPAILYVRLKDAVERNRDLLARAKRRGDLAVVAWLARNLVELRVWVEYCAMSEDNALEFSDDAIRDLVALNRKIPGLDDETRTRLEAAEAGLPRTKDSHKFKEARDAAAIASLGEFYNTNVKILSKYAHPTALSVMAALGEASVKPLRAQFSGVGLTIANEALQKLDSSFIGERYRQYAESMARANDQIPAHRRLK